MATRKQIRKDLHRKSEKGELGREMLPREGFVRGKPER
jgi:hypothetical protein